MTAEVECHHAAELVELGSDLPDHRALPALREAVREHDSKVLVTGQVGGVDRHTVIGDDGPRIRNWLGHRYILRERLRWSVAAEAIGKGCRQCPRPYARSANQPTRPSTEPPGPTAPPTTRA